MSRKVNSLIVILLSSLLCLNAWAGEKTSIRYVQAIKTKLLAEPKMAAAQVIELKRGDELQVLEAKDSWHQVQVGDKTGWVSKLFTSENKPVGNADLTKDVQVSMEKTSRRRSSSYAVSASTRGLNAEGRAREGRAKYQSDYGALKEVDDYKIKDQNVESFKNDAALGTTAGK